MSLKLRFTIVDEDDSADVAFDLTDATAKEASVSTIISIMEGYCKWLHSKMDAGLLLEHPYFRNYSPLRQTQILAEFQKKYNLYDLDHPSHTPKAPLIIVK